MIDFERARINMVHAQIRPTQVTDRRIMSAMLDIPRERFVPPSRRELAYIDEDVLVKEAQAGAPARYIMEPMPFARLVQLAEIGHRDLVLDIGCATGYSTAILAQLAESVVGVESDRDLAAAADEALVEIGIGNAAIVTAPLEQGCPKQGPYDVIVLEGAVGWIPDELFAQLRDGGRLVAAVQDGPVGKATLFQSAGGKVSSRIAFDMAIRPLPDFRKPPAFVF